jgi:hypothetical protein
MSEAQEEDLGQRILTVVAKSKRGLTIAEVAALLDLTFEDAKAAIERLLDQKRLVRQAGLTPNDRSETFALPTNED